MSTSLELFYTLAVALAIGLLIGIERGWKKREFIEGTRIAGVRTFGLIGLLGGVTALLSQLLSAFVFGVVFIGLAVVLVSAYVVTLKKNPDVGITTLIAALLTFILGALAVMDQVILAAISAVVMTLLLGYKPVLHRWVSALEGKELRAGIMLLLLSVVLLPILPDQGYGPWKVLNPYVIGWMVVLIALISFVGYFAIKIGGAKRGVVFTGLFGGLSASTAVTLRFSQLARKDTRMSAMLSMGVLLACGTMLPRMLLVAGAFNLNLVAMLWLPAMVMALLIYFPVILYWRSKTEKNIDTSSVLTNPLDLKVALVFGGVLVLIMLLSAFLKQTYGDAGILSLAAASGIFDVDAITLSLTRMSQDSLALNITVTGLVIAAASNNFVKATMASFIGGKEMALKVSLPLVVSSLGGLLSVWIWVW
ncbi:MgtC/SapB family protein [Hydrogenovibrio sp. 3SP14C1]|uniref:MgtC/SapB family protein n=1 Tax=Hydrogenovibrio sp. 3SP14C1 TaxID=3038774 RepID=UPI002417E8D8|nr:MgtC/SapB family protein [Hydrogenovibrio sp. 3SP14C1]MDG4812531.1 MgtC/SapB family protein [Hydrogenovibrio sp. 3SP14C1]